MMKMVAAALAAAAAMTPAQASQLVVDLEDRQVRASQPLPLWFDLRDLMTTSAGGYRILNAKFTLTGYSAAVTGSPEQNPNPPYEITRTEGPFVRADGQQGYDIWANVTDQQIRKDATQDTLVFQTSTGSVQGTTVQQQDVKDTPIYSGFLPGVVDGNNILNASLYSQNVLSGIYGDVSVSLLAGELVGGNKFPSLPGYGPFANLEQSIGLTEEVYYFFSITSTGDPFTLKTLTIDYDLVSDTSVGQPGSGTPTPVGDAPEPATWAMMIVGFGAVGSMMRRQPAKAKVGLS